MGFEAYDSGADWNLVPDPKINSKEADEYAEHGWDGVADTIRDPFLSVAEKVSESFQPWNGVKRLLLKDGKNMQAWRMGDFKDPSAMPADEQDRAKLFSIYEKAKRSKFFKETYLVDTPSGYCLVAKLSAIDKGYLKQRRKYHDVNAEFSLRSRRFSSYGIQSDRREEARRNAEESERKAYVDAVFDHPERVFLLARWCNERYGRSFTPIATLQQLQEIEDLQAERDEIDRENARRAREEQAERDKERNIALYQHRKRNSLLHASPWSGATAGTALAIWLIFSGWLLLLFAVPLILAGLSVCVYLDRLDHLSQINTVYRCYKRDGISDEETDIQKAIESGSFTNTQDWGRVNVVTIDWRLM